MSLAQRKDASKVSKHGRPVEDTWTHPTNPNKGNTRMHRLVDKWERAVASHAAKARFTNLHHRIRKRARIQSRHDSRDFADERHRFEDTTADRISSRFAGVFWIEARKKWRVTIYLSRSKREYFGEYEDEEEAAKAYDKRARVLGKETNFDDNGNERVRARAKNHSRHWGVSFYKRDGKYQGGASIGKQQLDLGCFVDETRAALAHDALARARPENKRFNFILKHAGHETAAETDPSDENNSTAVTKPSPKTNKRVADSNPEELNGNPAKKRKSNNAAGDAPAEPNVSRTSARPPQGLVPALSSQANKGRSMLAAALQPRVDEALVSGNASSLGPLNQLVIDLAGVRETEALIRVWDAMGGSKGAEERTWQAVEGLHSLGKDKIPRGTLALPVLHKRTLEPARRLHKICKGRRLSQRSDQALTVFEPAVKWVETQRAMGAASPHASYLNGQGAARHKLAQVLAAALCVPKETARGVVTKLKQRKKLG